MSSKEEIQQEGFFYEAWTEFKKFKNWALLGLFLFAVNTFKNEMQELKIELKGLTHEVSEVQKQTGVILIKVDGNDRRLSRLERLNDERGN